MSYSGVALRTGGDYTPWHAALSASWNIPENHTHWAELMYDQGTIPFVHLMVEDSMENIADGRQDPALLDFHEQYRVPGGDGKQPVLPACL